jgi:hypothetical protein
VGASFRAGDDQRGDMGRACRPEHTCRRIERRSAGHDIVNEHQACTF